jgi:membrane protein involved in colicin uptake
VVVIDAVTGDEIGELAQEYAARRAAEEQTKREATARRRAERKIQSEAKAREKAEERVRELEEELRRLRGEELP